MYYQTMDKKMFQRVVEQQQVATNITKELSINSRIVNCPYELITKHFVLAPKQIAHTILKQPNYCMVLSPASFK
jgi:hypothetical protein